MRVVVGLFAVLAALVCSGCLRTTYNHCTEMPPDRECELLDAGADGGPDAGADAGTADVGVDAGVEADVDAGADAG